MSGEYVCVRKQDNIIGYEVPDLSQRTDWEKIDTDLVETIIDSIMPIMKIIGYYEPAHFASKVRQDLEEGKAVRLTNFYVKKIQKKESAVC